MFLNKCAWFWRSVCTEAGTLDKVDGEVDGEVDG